MEPTKRVSATAQIRAAVAHAQNDLHLRITQGTFWDAVTVSQSDGNFQHTVTGCCPVSAVYLASLGDSLDLTKVDFESDQVQAAALALGVDFEYVRGFYEGYDKALHFTEPPYSIGTSDYRDGREDSFAYGKELGLGQ